MLSEEDAGRGGFAGEFAARADSIRAEFARTVDAASLADADGGGPRDAAEVTLAKRVAEGTWVVGDPRRQGRAEADAADAARLPGLSAVTGRVRGEVEARGGGLGASSVRMGVRGADWRWGPVLLDEVVVDAALDEKLGLKIEQLDVKVPGPLSPLIPPPHKLRPPRPCFPPFRLDASTPADQCCMCCWHACVRACYAVLCWLPCVRIPRARVLEWRHGLGGVPSRALTY